MSTWKDLSRRTFPPEAVSRISGVFSDLDDTLTTGGRMTAEAFSAMERLRAFGILMVIITGRPAGWCDHIARMWPVDAVVGENGAFYFRYDPKGRHMIRRYHFGQTQREMHRKQLDVIREKVLAEVPGAAVASDQAYRESDLAIDFCEDVPRLPIEDVEKIAEVMRGDGATAKISSIHVNCWFGEYDKISMTKMLMREVFGTDLDTYQDKFVFVGDSPNDSPMFAFFKNSIGVANVRAFWDRLDASPKYVTESKAGKGFCEVANLLITHHDD